MGEDQGVTFFLETLQKLQAIFSYLGVDDWVAMLESVCKGNLTKQIDERLYLLPTAWDEKIGVDKHSRFLVVGQLAKISYPKSIGFKLIFLTVSFVLPPGLSTNQGLTESKSVFQRRESYQLKHLLFLRICTFFFRFFRMTIPVMEFKNLRSPSLARYLWQEGSSSIITFAILYSTGKET